jgi:hypothetical protein
MEDDGIIRLNFMKELCRRDDEANKKTNNNTGTDHNVFSVGDIRGRSVRGFDLEKVVLYLRGMEMEDEPLIELVDPDRSERVKLTNAGRAHCEDFV